MREVKLKEKVNGMINRTRKRIKHKQVTPYHLEKLTVKMFKEFLKKSKEE